MSEVRVAGVSLTKRQRYWLEHVQACTATGQTIAEYTQTQGLEARAMYAGKKTLVQKGVLPRTRPPQFQRAQVVPVKSSEWHIQLSNGVSVSFSGSVEAGSLTTVLSIAAAVD